MENQILAWTWVCWQVLKWKIRGPVSASERLKVVAWPIVHRSQVAKALGGRWPRSRGLLELHYDSMRKKAQVPRRSTADDTRLVHRSCVIIFCECKMLTWFFVQHLAPVSILYSIKRAQGTGFSRWAPMQILANLSGALPQASISGSWPNIWSTALWQTPSSGSSSVSCAWLASLVSSFRCFGRFSSSGFTRNTRPIKNPVPSCYPHGLGQEPWSKKSWKPLKRTSLPTTVSSPVEMVWNSNTIQKVAAQSRSWSAMEWTAPTCCGSPCWIPSVTASAKIGGSSWPWSHGTIGGFTSQKLLRPRPVFPSELFARTPMTSCNIWNLKSGMLYVAGPQAYNAPWNMPDFTPKPWTAFFWSMDLMATPCTLPFNQCHRCSTCPWCHEFCPAPSTLYVSMFAQMPRSFRDSKLFGWNWMSWFHPLSNVWMASCWAQPALNTPWLPMPSISRATDHSIATTSCEFCRLWTATVPHTPCLSCRCQSWWFVDSWISWRLPSANTKLPVWRQRWSWCQLQLGPITASLKLHNWQARRWRTFSRRTLRSWRSGEQRTESHGQLDGTCSSFEHGAQQAYFPCSAGAFVEHSIWPELCTVTRGIKRPTVPMIVFALVLRTSPCGQNGSPAYVAIACNRLLKFNEILVLSLDRNIRKTWICKIQFLISSQLLLFCTRSVPSVRHNWRAPVWGGSLPQIRQITQQE